MDLALTLLPHLVQKFLAFKLGCHGLPWAGGLEYLGVLDCLHGHDSDETHMV